jgi:nicotinamidase-related amidase
MSRSYDEDRAFFQARSFGQSLGLGKRPALVNVDFQVAFTDPSCPLGANADAEIAASRRLIDAARRHGLPIFFLGIRFEDPDQRDAGLWGEKIGKLKMLAAGTPGIAIDPRLGVTAADAIVWKKRASGFFNTDLLARLTLAGIDSLVMTGLTTSGCLRATAVDAVSYGFRTAVVRECVGDRARAPHDQALFDLEQKYCDVISLDDALAYVNGKENFGSIPALAISSSQMA